MAEKVTVELVDDLDGSPAAEKVLFALGGSQYEIDLSAQNAENLRKALKPYIDAARPPGRSSATVARQPRSEGGRKRQSNYDAEAAASARAYFQEHRDQLPEGVTVPSRGRTPAAAVEAWRALGKPGL